MAASTASTAIFTLPLVPFLKPTGQDRPEAISRWIWLSVVRAPIAPQATRSAMYCGRGHVEELAAGRQAERVDVEQQAAREPQAVVDAEAAVEVGVVDQPLPAHGGARLFEVDAHHDLEVVGVTRRARAARRRGVVEGGLGVVDRAGADDDDQAVVVAVQDGVDARRGRRRPGRRW